MLYKLVYSTSPVAFLMTLIICDTLVCVVNCILFDVSHCSVHCRNIGAGLTAQLQFKVVHLVDDVWPPKRLAYSIQTTGD